MSGIEDKVVVITGASSGIGEATARLLAQRGAKVILGARGLDRLEGAAAQIAAAGRRVSYRQVDVRNRQDVSDLIDLALERYGQLDVMINNAGVSPNSLLDDLKVEDWENMIDINIKGTLYGIAAALPVFRQQGHGHFINILSTAGLVIRPTMAVYAGTKNAVRAITEGLRQEAGADLRVTAISPGYVKTDLAASITDPGLRAQVLGSMDQFAISPLAIAEAIAFAISQPRDVDVSEIVIRPTAQA